MTGERGTVDAASIPSGRFAAMVRAQHDATMLNWPRSTARRAVGAPVTRDALLAKIEAALATGRTRLNLTDIASAAGVRRDALRQHFTSLDTLLTALHAARLARLEWHLVALRQRRDGLAAFIHVYLDDTARGGPWLDQWMVSRRVAHHRNGGRARLVAMLQILIERHGRVAPGHQPPTAIELLDLLETLTTTPRERTVENQSRHQRLLPAWLAARGITSLAPAGSKSEEAPSPARHDRHLAGYTGTLPQSRDTRGQDVLVTSTGGLAQGTTMRHTRVDPDDVHSSL